MAWLGHVMQMDGGRMPGRILEWRPMGRRIRGRPRKRSIEDVEEDIQTMGIRTRKGRNGRKSSRRLKPIVGCNANIRRRRTTILAVTHVLDIRPKDATAPFLYPVPLTSET